uniref:Uncharacterized protein n=1 Tax=Anguilla anguilla TaxID=7936 RepID=A0A0E9WKJ1_ANGAN
MGANKEKHFLINKDLQHWSWRPDLRFFLKVFF